MLTLPHYQIQTPIYEGVRSLIYRAFRKEDHLPVILKLLKEDYPTPEMLSYFHREYDMMQYLNQVKGIVLAYSLEKYQHTLVMCLEDFGGEALKSWMLKQSLTVQTFLPLAIQIADNLGYIHAARVIHKDINPANIVWNPKTQQLKIIDFGIASRLARENPTLKNPEQLEGTLAYLSPEQTGRMNRSLDYRTDLYSLGVTFYELLTGKVPFESTSPLELIHCHLAKAPVLVCQVNPEIPRILSDLVMKLMAKNVEDRYQSAFGVRADLEKCQAQLETTNTIEIFKLAQNDFSGQFQISQKLYGRESEVNILLQAFERIATSSPSSSKQRGGEMIFISGYSGVGKTSLMYEVHKPMTEKHGYFASGTFDQFQRNVPYSALTQAFNAFCRYLLTENFETLKAWRERILLAIGGNGQVLIDVIPQLELLIGPQPSVAQVGYQAAQHRFHWVFKNFFRAICQAEHPLVLFIDDLQWADLASLNLLHLLMTDADSRHFLIIGAYRDNEVDATHPLTLMIKDLQHAEVTFNRIALRNLSFTEANTLMAESLNSELDDVQGLTKLVYEKTQGNAFFTHEFLKSLYAQGLLNFDIAKQRWQWKIEQIQATSMTDNVIELMVNKIHQLSGDTQTALKLASCIGNPFDLKTLSVIHQHSQLDTLSHLWTALEEGLLFPLDEHYQQSEQLENLNSHFKFQHDRLQQAAYSLVTDAEKPDLHLRIGEYLLLIHDEDKEEKIFTIVDHLNLGVTQVDTQAHKDEIAQLNLLAGLKAQAAMAYGAAVNYFKAGLALLEAESWSTAYELTLKLYTATVEAEFLNAHFEVSEQFSQVVLQQAKTLLDQIKIYEVRISLYMVQNQMQKALDTALHVLEKLGVQLENRPPQNLSVAAYYQLPQMRAPEKLAAMRILNFAISPAYTVAPERFPQIVFTMVSLSIQHGNSALSIFGYSTYGLLLCAAFGEIEAGYQVGQLAISLVNQLDARESKAKGFAAYYVGVHHWKKHARETIEPLLEAGQSGLESGDVEFVGVTAMHCGSYLFWVGQALNRVAQIQAKLLARIQSVKQEYQQIYLNIWRQTVFNLQGLNSDPRYLIGEAFNEEELLPKVLETHYGMAIFGIYLAKLMLCYIFKEPLRALHNVTLAEQYEQANLGVMVVPIYRFYASLTLLACYSSATKEEQLAILQKVESYQLQMKQWATHAPQNYQHRYDLVEAEKAKVLGQLEALVWYEQAIQGAKHHEYLQEEALAYELAAEFYLGRGMEKFAQTYLKEAQYCYQQWGALAKVHDLEKRYPHWLTQKQTSATCSTVGISTSTATQVASATKQITVSKILDLESVMKASQTLFEERALSCLLETMMNIVIENAGAQRGFLLLPRHGQWVIEAEGSTEKKEVTVLQSLPIQNHLPEAIIHYVARTQDNVVLANAQGEGLYTQHPYIKEHQTQSVLCFPIIYQQQLRAILYLENNLTLGAFTEERLNLLKMFSSQIAISLENVQYATQLEEKVKERTDQLAGANQKIMALNERLKEENLRMSAELDVAKRLQQMVLPKKEELQHIEGLEIAGFMEPADEVGGDYYDVLVNPRHVKIAIGDVTGHGLESGVLMLMLQTAIRSLFIAGIPAGKEFLAILNRIIYDNVQRIRVDKNLTLSLLDYQDGQLQITGQHEEVLLVRLDGRVTRVDTLQLGFLVGIVAEMSQWISLQEFQLNPGDGIVLYTDGLTEARNVAEEQYGVERLCDIVSQNWHLSVKAIQQIIIDDVRQHLGSQKIDDDITLLVLKQK